VTLFVDYDGWYEDDEGTHRLANEVLRAVQTMTIGQKVLIIEEKDRNPEKDKDNREKETLIWLDSLLCHSTFADTIIGLFRYCRCCRSVQATLALDKMSRSREP
jgi:hypothetical protein